MTIGPPPPDDRAVFGPAAPALATGSAPRRRRIGWKAVTALLVAIALLAGGVVALTHGRTEQHDADRSLARARQQRAAAQAVLHRAERELVAARAAVAGFGVSAQAATTATGHVLDLEVTVVDLVARLRAAGESTDIGTYNRLVDQLNDASQALVTAFDDLEGPFRKFSDAIDVLPSAHCDAPVAATLRWTKYGDQGLQCARLRVPLDYFQPGGGTIQVTVVRRPADGPTSLGPLFVNPGGPGFSAISSLRDSVILLPPEVLQKFDLIAMDPRGVGQSTPVDCADDLDPLFDPDLADVPSATSSAAIDEVARIIQGCATRSGPILAHVDTGSVARDMDRVRAALGAETLTYLGYSYGTYLGAVYADLFPTRVRAAVLDGAVDPRRASDVDVSGDAQSFEVALNAALADCGRNPACPFHAGGDPQHAFDRLMDRIAAAPLTVAGHRIGRTLAETAVVASLYEGEGGWPRLMQALADANAGNGAGLQDLADTYTGRRPDGSFSDEIEAHYAVDCVDVAGRLTPAQAKHRAAALATNAGRFAAVALAFELPCAFWPVPPHAPPGKLDAAGSPPLLVIGSEGDPVTPIQGAEDLSTSLVNGHLLRAPGSAHTSFARGNPCIDNVVVRYLVDLSLPGRDAPCGG